MTILPQLEHDLIVAARRRPSAGQEPVAPLRLGARFALRVKALRVPIVAVAVLLASATIALAATGVILTGAPVAPSEQQNPNVGDGVPAPGASQLLPLRMADPEGGLPWGMRLINTTRGKLCVQVGRVQGGQLGELGVDGAFNNDGRFHPLPPSALPPLTPVGLQPPGDTNTSCNLIGQATVAQHIGLDRSASGLPPSARVEVGFRRDIYYGILGPDAVSVTYSDRTGKHTQRVLPESGTYLIVQRTAPGEQIETAGGSIETYGEAVPSAPLTAISYRIGGKLCERGPVQPPWATTPTVNTCPQVQAPSASTVQQALHIPLQVQLVTHDGVVTGADVSFTAPYAITDASHQYAISVPDCQTVDGQGGAMQLLDENVTAGATLHFHLSDPFLERCGRDAATVERQVVTIEALYQHTDGGASTVIGSTTVSEPPSTRTASSPASR